MTQLLGYSIWLGHVGDSRDLRRIHELGILAMIDLAADEKPPLVTRDLVYCRFPIVDAAGNLPWVLTGAVETLARLLRENVPTFVFCSAGMSRTPCVTACSLAIVTGSSPKECLERVLQGRPADVTPDLWQELVQVCGLA